MPVSPLFQFHSGTIKRAKIGNIISELENFNSSVVQLKAGSFIAAIIRIRFQFLSGTIKRSYTKAGEIVIPLFQFLSGTIKS